MYKTFLLIGCIFLIIQCLVLAQKVPEIIESSKKGDLLKVRQLVEYGEDIDARDKNNLTALMWASYKGYIEIARLLIEKGADVNANGPYPALTWAAANGQKEIVYLLLEKGADINAVNEHGCTALMLASFLGEHETAKILIDKGADINTRSKYGVTALMMAKQKLVLKQKKRKEIVQLLTEAGAAE